MTDLINHLLDIEKIESGNVNVNLTKTNILTMVKRVIVFNQPQAEFKQIKLSLEISIQRHFTMTDGLVLSQILDNLISNAIKYSPINTTVQIRVLKKADKIRIEIQNQGQGLTAQDQEKLFLKFSRLSAKTTANENSTGLGLYISQQLAAMLHTKINCDSTENQGATFSVEL